MDMSLTERRQIENEMIFRRANEKIGDDLDALDAPHIEEGTTYPMYYVQSATKLLYRFQGNCVFLKSSLVADYLN